jgi:8-oxo-dGTP pyrophosphatase MutT (NUDIX family)
MNSKLKAAYGGVVVDATGRVLLREPTNHFGGYVWTFPKGKADPGEDPETAALREVLEETGCAARILAPVPGDFTGDTSMNHYFLMAEAVPGAPLAAHDGETAQVRWVSFEAAKALISQTPNLKGKVRDLAVLEAAKGLLLRKDAELS